jgi:hypothetical protein
MLGDRACRDFQVYRLAMAVPAREGAERERALIALDRLRFVGLVQVFGAVADNPLAPICTSLSDGGQAGLRYCATQANLAEWDKHRAA